MSVEYFHVKMLMNVWWRMVGVQRCATTQREVSSAAAFYQAMRSQRTVPTVLVCRIGDSFSVNFLTCKECICPSMLLILWPSLLDIDECTTGVNNCDSNATCANTISSYFCACLEGYTGDGYSCERKVLPA